MQIIKKADKYVLKLSYADWKNIGSNADWLKAEAKKRKQAPKDVCWEGYEMVGMKEKNGKEVPNCVPKNNKKASCSACGCETDCACHHSKKEGESGLEMFRANLKNIQNLIESLMQVSDEEAIEGWVADKISTAKENLSNVNDYLRFSEEYIDVEGEPEEQALWYGDQCEELDKIDDSDSHLVYEESPEQYMVLASKSKKGKNVKLNKPFRTPNGPKKFSVYVKNGKGNVVKVNFGDPNMEIKRDDPNRRSNFRARHNCDNPGPKWKARYWSCKMWSSKSVSSIVG